MSERLLHAMVDAEGIEPSTCRLRGENGPFALNCTASHKRSLQMVYKYLSLHRLAQKRSKIQSEQPPKQPSDLITYVM